MVRGHRTTHVGYVGTHGTTHTGGYTRDGWQPDTEPSPPAPCCSTCWGDPRGVADALWPWGQAVPAPELPCPLFVGLMVAPSLLPQNCPCPPALRRAPQPLARHSTVGDSATWPHCLQPQVPLPRGRQQGLSCGTATASSRAPRHCCPLYKRSHWQPRGDPQPFCPGTAGQTGPAGADKPRVPFDLLPDVTRCHRCLPGAAWHSLAQPRRVWYGIAWNGSVWDNLEQFGMARCGTVWYGIAWQFGMAQPVTSWCGITWNISVWDCL